MGAPGRSGGPHLEVESATWKLGPSDGGYVPVFVTHERSVVAFERLSAENVMHVVSCAGVDGAARRFPHDDAFLLSAEFVLGADGTSYAAAVLNANVGQPKVEVIAFTPTFDEAWRVSLQDRSIPIYGGPGSFALSDEGVIFMATQKLDGTGELVAIQTDSPGRAATAWSGGRGDNLGTGWTDW